MAHCIDRKQATDLFHIIRIDHLEFTVQDATSTSKILKTGLGMKYIGESRKETGNHEYCSFVLQTGEIKFVVNAPYLSEFKPPASKMPNPSFDSKKAIHFYTRHGSGVNAIGIEVGNCHEAWKISTSNGAQGVVPPTILTATQEEGGGQVIFCEIIIYNEDDPKNPTAKSDTILRFIQYDNFKGPFLPGYKPIQDKVPLDYGITKIDHVVGNVYSMNKIIEDLKKWTGMHTFAAFSKEEIQTPWTSLNSEVLSNNDSRVLFPVNEAAEGKAESQILEFLKAYNGPGVQHLALKSSNIFKTIRDMNAAHFAGFEFIPTPSTYYEDPIIIKRMSENLEPSEIEAIKELGILVDLDDEGILLQIFTKPLFDRPTNFVEIIQRKCKGVTIEIPGCGGFGKGNFKALFESIERLQALRGGLIPTDAGKVAC